MTRGVCSNNPWRSTRNTRAPLRCCPGLTSMLISNRSMAIISVPLRLARECTSRLPNLQWPHLSLAAAYAQSEQFEEARAEAAEVLRINPGFTIERWKRLAVYKDPKDVEHRIDGLRKAGLPET